MKITIISLIGFLSIIPTVNAQIDLYVGNGSYVYVEGEVLFVRNGLQLENGADDITTGSHIYLRDGAQLLQENNIKNSDEGELSVYQNQTGGIHEYTYWCSPVGAGTGNTQGDAPFSPELNLHQPTTAFINETNSGQYVVVPSLWNSTASTLAGRWIWQAMNANSYGNWSFIGNNASTVQSGAGYTQKGSPISNDVIDFRGRPNTGTITITATPGSGTLQTNYDGLTGNQVQMMIGNPYPSAMDLKTLFINPSTLAFDRNTFLERAVYFWEDAGVATHYMLAYQGGYAKYIPGNMADLNDNGTYTVANFTSFLGTGSITGGATPGSGNYTGNNRRYAAIGQGFVLVTDAATTSGSYSLVIDNSMRLYMGQDNAFASTGAIFNKVTANSSSTTNETIAMSHNGLDYQNIVNNPTIIPEIRIYTHIDDTYYRESVIAFRSGTSLNYSNQGTDGLLVMKLPSDAYILADGHELSIKSLMYDVDVRLPFGIVAENTTNNVFDIQIRNLKDTPSSMEVFIYDNVTDTYTNIINDTFSVTLDQGTYNNRFEITFKALDATLDIEENEISDSFTVFQNNTASSLIIKNPESHNVKAFTMFDVSGKLIYNKINLGANTEYRFPTNTLSTGAYLVKITTKNNVEITKKVIVHNN